MAKPIVVLSRKLPLAENEPVWVELQRLANVKVPTRIVPLARNTDLKKAVGIVPLVTDKVDAAFLAKAPKLKVIGNYGVGYNNIDVHEANSRGIVVCNTPDVLTNATAELTIGLIFAAARRFKEGTELLRRNAFKAWAPSLLLGRELAGARLGIVGFGRIGQSVAAKARALGMDVVVYSRVPRQNSYPDTRFLAFDELLRTSDFVSIHCPLSIETRNLIGARQFSIMKRESYLINTARGEIVDETAMLQALKKGVLRGAALDVFWNEPKLRSALKAHPSIFVLPHLGSASLEARSGMARLAVSGIVEVLSGRNPQNRVN